MSLALQVAIFMLQLQHVLLDAALLLRKFILFAGMVPGLPFPL